ncbi:Nucleoside 2-deoxyribosyltransferase [Janthinobacterium lividum]|uniref:Nucleoside 2-deoxyribosyltransferase n=1 Tax=Janthinobacterium lividum TaxID=29581 RepID=A0AB38C7H5_9BURK|nr:nucleoside 2-deoxyribosyltransferase [Janthinobacterium lividum]SFX48014.1 Nucleoside 2-deoxyribosyltransferase [Janthinobacterium lividum]
MNTNDAVLIVGEIVIDYTVPQDGAGCKVRLGGIVHSARGLWAAGAKYSVAAFCPQYVVELAEHFLYAHGCGEFIWLGEVVGAPNVIVIGDVIELAHQGYEDLLREHKKIVLRQPLPNLSAYSRVIVFPGKFDLGMLVGLFPVQARISFDIAYDVKDLSSLRGYEGRVDAIIISTSSELFLRAAQSNLEDLIAEVRALSAEVFLLKENRGGSRFFDLRETTIEEIPASLGTTVNSVGVGDVYSAVMVALSNKGWSEAAWRGCQAATAYSQTTFPDDLQRDLQRAFKMPMEVLRDLGGTSLPWHERPRFSIYLAGPDFSYVEKHELDRAIASLEYHNFNVIRPIQENGELTLPATPADLIRTYHLDYELLKRCDAMFAIPLGRDPGTLVEIGMAVALGKPTITYDPRKENSNTMVLGGSVVYSSSLDECLNGVFTALAQLRAGNL